MVDRPSSDRPLAALAPPGSEYRFKIDAYTPATMPMARLAEYMRELADVLGEPSAVHFDRLKAGSTVLVSKVDYEAVPKVRARANAVRRGEAPREAQRAYKNINRLLREDNGVAVLQERRLTAVIIRFPGREEPEETFPAIGQHGSIDGVIVRIGGRDQTVHITLESEGEQISGCYTTRQIGKQLGHKLFEPVRLFGRGRWSRDGDGRWTLRDFKVDRFEALKDVSLSSALAEIRSIQAEWSPDALSELDAIRHGQIKNGGH